LLYFVDDNGVSLTCLEAKTGQVVKTARLGTPFTASPVYAGGHLYFFDQNGRGYVVRPGRDFEVVATNTLDAGCMASPAVLGKALFVRTKTHLYRIEGP
jgi:outer membrane protein assembly factor BamB